MLHHMEPLRHNAIDVWNLSIGPSLANCSMLEYAVEITHHVRPEGLSPGVGLPRVAQSPPGPSGSSLRAPWT